MSGSTGPTVVELLADRDDLIEAVTDLRWREWGRAPEPTDRAWWRGDEQVVLVHQAGRDRLGREVWAVDGEAVIEIARRVLRRQRITRTPSRVDSGPD